MRILRNPEWGCQLRIGLFVGLILICPSFLSGDMIVFKNGERPPVFGVIQNQTDASTTISVIEDVWDSSLQLTQIPNDEIDVVVRNFDSARLLRLNPTKLADYQSYAIELGSQTADPIAHNLSIRLHMIVVGNARDSSPSERSAKIASLRSLLKLTRNEKERLAIDSLLRLETGQSPVVSKSAPKPPPVDAGQSNKKILEAIQLIRRNKMNSASKLVGDQKVAELFDRWKPVLSASEIRRIASLERLGADELRRLLSVELAIKKGQGSLTESAVNDWKSQAKETGASEFKLPQLSAVNEFDPQASLFRDGKWVRSGR